MRQGILKRAMDTMIRVPGVPITISSRQPAPIRLSGMDQGVDPEIIEIVNRGMREKKDPQEILQEVSAHGALNSTAMGAAGGGVAGSVGGRLWSGEAAHAPMAALWEQGLKGQTPKNILAALAKVPLAARIAPLAGAGAGALAGAAMWHHGKDDRMQQAIEASKGLSREQMLDNSTLLSTLPESHPLRRRFAKDIRKSIPVEDPYVPMIHANQAETAHAQVPHAVLPGGK